MLWEAGVVGEDLQMVEAGCRQPEMTGLQSSYLMGPRLCAAYVAHLPEKPGVLRTDVAPHHVAPEGVGLFAHRLTLRVIRQEIDDFAGDCLSIAERHQPAPTVGEHFLGIPIRGRDGRLAGAKRIAEDTRDDLLTVEVWGDAEIGGAEEFR